MQKLAFGTDGIRGRVGEFPFVPEVLYSLSAALGDWMMERYSQGDKSVKVLIAGDTRESVDSIKKIINSCLVKFPIEVVDIGVVPTPAVLTLIRKDPSFACGIVISASHNPYHDNGIKLFDAAAGKITALDELRIVELFESYACGERKLSTQLSGIESSWPQAESLYIESVVAAVPPAIGKGLKIVLDCAHGATYRIAPEIFRAIGAQVIVLHDSPDGININENAGALHPEALQAAVLREGANIGFAFDGDGDRIVMVSLAGHAKDGDDVLAVLLDLEEYAAQPVIVGTVMSNSGLEMYLHNQAKAFVRTSVGDKYIIAKLDELELVLGGEPSGHVILKNYLPSGDGILVAVKAVQSLQESKKWELDHIVKFPQLVVNVPVASKRDLKSEPYAGILRMYDEMLAHGRILVRYSGTEPLLRIMVEGEDPIITQQIAQRLASDLQLALNS
jgi:phosphoglucosamine mutase